jgi:nifR3 family TIM-barrel protein
MRIGPLEIWPPVVLAPMAGVTNAPFRQLCRSYSEGRGLFVSEMVLAEAFLHNNARTERMLSFAPGEWPRSVQLYGSDPAVVGTAVARLVGEGRVDHIDLNFGCPARKVTRRGGGAAVPLKPRLLAGIVAGAVRAAGVVPVTVKFRMGLNDALPTSLTTGRIAEAEGAAAVALHARTAEQHYAGPARWDAIGELKAAVTSIPVLGNGDVWEAVDALRMMESTGCDGVVVGRGCLGRPWLFRDLGAVFAATPVPLPPTLGDVASVLREHAALLVDWFGPRHGPLELRKHAGWYVTGYPVAPDLRRRLALVSSLAELDGLLAELDTAATLRPGAERLPRGHTNGPITVALPDGYLDDREDDTPPVDAGRAALTGG